MRGGKRESMARRMQAIDRAVSRLWIEDYEAHMKASKDVSARIRMTAEEIAASTKGGAWAKAIDEASAKILEAEAIRWKDITRSETPFWRARYPSSSEPIRGASFDRVFIDESAQLPERLIYERQRYGPNMAEGVMRAVDEMGGRLRYLQERVDRLEAALDEERAQRKRKRPEPPARKTRAYGIR